VPRQLAVHRRDPLSSCVEHAGTVMGPPDNSADGISGRNSPCPRSCSAPGTTGLCPGPYDDAGPVLAPLTFRKQMRTPGEQSKNQTTGEREAAIPNRRDADRNCDATEASRVTAAARTVTAAHQALGPNDGDLAGCRETADAGPRDVAAAAGGRTAQSTFTGDGTSEHQTAGRLEPSMRGKLQPRPRR
jgi:hypothetical protein